MVKYRFMCIECNHVYLINHQKVRFFDGSLCEKCGGKLIPKGKEEEYGCPFDEPAYNPNPPEDNDFTAEDDEPIPYTVTDYITEHHKIALEIAELLDQKRQDYGTENIKKFGSYGVLVRVSDKVERLINLSKRDDTPNFESVEDTWRDIAGYAILALIELREGR